METSVNKAPLPGVFAEAFPTTTGLSRVDYRDVAEVAAIGLTEDRLNFGTFELCASGLLNRNDIAGIMSEVARREIRAEEVSFEECTEKMFFWQAVPGIRFSIRFRIVVK